MVNIDLSVLILRAADFENVGVRLNIVIKRDAFFVPSKVSRETL